MVKIAHITMSYQGLVASVHREIYRVRQHTHCRQNLVRNIEDLDLVGNVASHAQQGITIFSL